MVNRVKKWLREGRDVRIMTARVSKSHSAEEREMARRAIQQWCRKYLGKVLPVTNEKDGAMEVLYDDRARQVQLNTGRLIGQKER